jgi:peptidyl-prolyl cis-trans isomerase D
MVGPDQNPKDVLKQLLTSQGLSEKDLTQSIQREMATGIMANTLQSAFTTLSEPLVIDLYKVDNEKRTLDYVVFMDKDVKNIPQPSDDDLQKLYESTKENFAIPERRSLRMIKLSEDSVRKTISVTKEEVLRIYEQTKESYFTPPARLLDEALLDTEEQAKKVHELLLAGTSVEAAVTKVTGKNIAYLGSKSVADNELRPEIEEAALEVTKPETPLEPVQTPVGWYVVEVKKIIPGGYKPFDDLRKELETDLFENKLSDAIYDVATKVDDLLAGGATIEDLKKQVDVTIVDLPLINAFGQDANGNNALKAYEKTASTILETGFQLGEGETSPVSEMADRSYAAISILKVEPKAYKPITDVKKELATKWADDFSRTENRGMVNKYLADIKSGTHTLAKAAEDAGKSTQTARALSRRDAPPKVIITEMANLIFTSPRNEPFLLPADGGVVLAVVSDIKWPETVDTKSESYKTFRDKVINDTRNESLMAYIEHKNKEYKAVINKTLLQNTYGKTDAAQ